MRSHQVWRCIYGFYEDSDSPPPFYFIFILFVFPFHLPPSPVTSHRLQPFLPFSPSAAAFLPTCRTKGRSARTRERTRSQTRLSWKTSPARSSDRWVHPHTHTGSHTKGPCELRTHEEKIHSASFLKIGAWIPIVVKFDLKQTAHSCTCQSNLCLLYFPDKVSVGKTLCWFTAAPVKHYTHFFLFFLEITTSIFFFFPSSEKRQTWLTGSFSRTAEMIWNEMFHTSSDPLEDNGPDRRAHLNTIANGNKVH